MNKAPLVSIVIPTYNHAQFLEKCLQSVINQTYMDWEAIVVNNFSEDDTVEIVQSFKDPRIRLVNFKNHGVIAASRNQGIRLALGKYIAFLDSDDTWYPTKLHRCITELTEKTDLVCHGMRYIKNKKKWKDVRCGPAKKASYYNLLYNGNCLITSAVMARKTCLQAVGGFSEDPNIVTSEDYDLWLKLSKKRIGFHFIDEILGEYLVHESSASKTVLRHMQSVRRVIEKHHASTGKINIFRQLTFKRATALLYYGAARRFQQNGQKTEALRYYGKSIFIFPFILKIYAGIFLTVITKAEEKHGVGD